MKIRCIDRLKKDYRELPLDIQQGVDQKLRFPLRDLRHPSLRAHKVRGVEGLSEFSVTMTYRALFEIEGEYYVLVGVGPHRMVDRI